jgi:hypothetical protein
MPFAATFAVVAPSPFAAAFFRRSYLYRRRLAGFRVGSLLHRLFTYAISAKSLPARAFACNPAWDVLKSLLG